MLAIIFVLVKKEHELWLEIDVQNCIGIGSKWGKLCIIYLVPFKSSRWILRKAYPRTCMDSLHRSKLHCNLCSMHSHSSKKKRWTFTSNRSLQKFHLIDGLVVLSKPYWWVLFFSKFMGKKLHCASAASKQEDLSDTWIQGISFRRWDYLVYIICINMLYIYLYIQLMYMIYIYI